MNILQLPKVELHLHLDCSLSYEVVRKIDPGITEDAYMTSFVGPQKCTDLSDYLTRAVHGIQLMQSAENLDLVTIDLFDQLARDNVIYAEIRFAPFEHTKQGLKAAEVVRRVNASVSAGIEKTGIKAGILLCTLREYPEELSMETIKLVEAFKGSHVVGFDIAGDEGGFPIDAHIPAFKYAKKKGIPCTAHAGEASGAAGVKRVIDEFKPLRIGHGARCIENQSLMTEIKKEKIHLEVCPTSNIQTNVFSRIEDHPLNQFYGFGLSMSLNTDTRTITHTTLSREYEKVRKTFGWKAEHFLKCNLEAVRHAFTTMEIKKSLHKRLLAGYRGL